MKFLLKKFLETFKNKPTKVENKKEPTKEKNVNPKNEE